MSRHEKLNASSNMNLSIHWETELNFLFLEALKHGKEISLQVFILGAEYDAQEWGLLSWWDL